MLVPEVTADLLGVAEVGMDDPGSSARNLVDALVNAAAVDYEVVTGTPEWPQTPLTEQDRRYRLAFLCLLVAAALRLKKVQTGLDAVEAHNPDVQQNAAFNIDLVRVIGRAERGVMQRARKLIRGDAWLRRLVGDSA